MKATKIKMKTGCEHSTKTTEISMIYIEGCNNPGCFSKANIYDYLKEHPSVITSQILYFSIDS